MYGPKGFDIHLDDISSADCIKLNLKRATILISRETLLETVTEVVTARHSRESEDYIVSERESLFVAMGGKALDGISFPDLLSARSNTNPVIRRLLNSDQVSVIDIATNRKLPNVIVSYDGIMLGPLVGNGWIHYQFNRDTPLFFLQIDWWIS